MRIFGWTGGQDGCAFYRVEVPLTELARWGHQVAYGVRRSNDIPGKGSGWLRPDVLIGQRVSQPGASQGWAAATDTYRVYELDDDLLNVDSSSPAYSYYSQPWVQHSILRNIHAADAVTVSTPYLADRFAQLNRNIHVIPNALPNSAFASRTAQWGEPFRVGWAGSSTHAMDWEACADGIARAFRRDSTLTMKFIGANYQGLIGLDMGRVKSVGWTYPVPRMYGQLDFHVGLAPLACHEFNRSKSPIKAMEYGARGIPTIASDYGPYRDYIQHGVTGFLVRHDHEWGKYLHVLKTDESLYESMSCAAQEQAIKFLADRRVREWTRTLGLDRALPPKVSHA